MIGCAIVGGLMLLGAAKLMRRHRHCGYGYGCGGGGWRQHGYHGHGRFGYGHEGPHAENDGFDAPQERGGWTPRWVLDRVLRRLQTSPSQSREVTEAFDAFADEMKGLRGEGKRTREDLAKALRQPSFDGVLLGELYARHDEAIEKARKALVGLMDRVHRVLEDEQRERLADLIEKGPQFWRHRGNW